MWEKLISGIKYLYLQSVGKTYNEINFFKTRCFWRYCQLALRGALPNNSFAFHLPFVHINRLWDSSVLVERLGFSIFNHFIYSNIPFYKDNFQKLHEICFMDWLDCAIYFDSQWKNGLVRHSWNFKLYCSTQSCGISHI